MSWWGRSQRAVWAVYYCRLLKQSHPARNAPRRNLGSVWIAGQHSFIQICTQTRLNMKRGNFLSMCACDFNTKILCSNKTVTSIWICFFPLSSMLKLTQQGPHLDNKQFLLQFYSSTFSPDTFLWVYISVPV